jgi:hypothetical protein
MTPVDPSLPPHTTNPLQYTNKKVKVFTGSINTIRKQEKKWFGYVSELHNLFMHVIFYWLTLNSTNSNKYFSKKFKSFGACELYNTSSRQRCIKGTVRPGSGRLVALNRPLKIHDAPHDLHFSEDWEYGKAPWNKRFHICRPPKSLVINLSFMWHSILNSF